MTHPAIDEAAAGRLRAVLAGAEPEAGPSAAAAPAPTSAPVEPPAPLLGEAVNRVALKASVRVKALARRAAAPAVARLRTELAGVAAAGHEQLSAEVAALRQELARTRAEHAAEVAALHEEIAAKSLRSPPPSNDPACRS